MIQSAIQRGDCAWCRQPIPAPQSFASVYIKVGPDQIEERGPFHQVPCLDRFQAARGRITQEHRPA